MQKGDKVRFRGATDGQVKWGGGNDPRIYLKQDKIYEIEVVSPSDWHTSLLLKGFPDLWFNDVSFIVVED